MTLIDISNHAAVPLRPLDGKKQESDEGPGSKNFRGRKRRNAKKIPRNDRTESMKSNKATQTEKEIDLAELLRHHDIPTDFKADSLFFKLATHKRNVTLCRLCDTGFSTGTGQRHCQGKKHHGVVNLFETLRRLSQPLRQAERTTGIDRMFCDSLNECLNVRVTICSLSNSSIAASAYQELQQYVTAYFDLDMDSAQAHLAIAKDLVSKGPQKPFIKFGKFISKAEAVRDEVFDTQIPGTAASINENHRGRLVHVESLPDKSSYAAYEDQCAAMKDTPRTVYQTKSEESFLNQSINLSLENSTLDWDISGEDWGEVLADLEYSVEKCKDDDVYCHLAGHCVSTPTDDEDLIGHQKAAEYGEAPSDPTLDARARAEVCLAALAFFGMY
jgi:hypothetical protein